MSAAEMSTLRDRIRIYAAQDRCELFKTTGWHDGARENDSRLNVLRHILVTKPAVMILYTIYYARIPTTDVPFLAHVFTSPLDVFPIAYFFSSRPTEARLG
jgi:hypothetical protein